LKPQHTILNEIKEIAPTLMEVSIDMPYTVPKGYFEQLSESVLEKAKFGLESHSIPKGYKVPEQYFSGLASKILQRVKDTETGDVSVFNENESIAPILNTISNKMPFSIPEQYFEHLSVQIPSEKAKVIPLKMMRNWMTYAAAAVFLGIMVTGSFLFSDKKQSQDFEKYQNMDVSAALDQVSDAELNSYIDENHASSVDDLTENERTNLDNLDDKIQSMSTENLSQFLNENGFLELKPENSIDK
jgi:hypothetical protein